MITEYFLKISVAIMQFVFGLLPSLPQMPDAIKNATGFFINASEHAGNLMAWLYGDILWTAMLLAVVAYFAFEQIYKLLHFSLRAIGIIMLVNRFK